MTKTEQTQKVKSLQVGFSIIDFVARSPKPVRFNDIHHETKVTKSNLYKYLNTLTDLNVLYRDEETGLYSGGTALIEYGMTTINNDNVIEKVTPYLEKINILTGVTTLLTTWTRNGPIIAKMINSRDGLNLGGQVGTILPVNSAGGKLFAAFMDGPLAKKWKEAETKRFTDDDITQLHNDLQFIQKNNIAFAHEALAPFVYSSAIPFFNYNNEIVGAIVIVGFENSIPKDINSSLSKKLIDFSKQISEIFGYED